MHGVVPNVVGLRLRHARTRLRRLQLSVRVVRFARGKPGRVLAQRPSPGVAAGRNLEVRLTVGRAG
jgi:beta-lactam-binding protein with PASTA domain